MLDERNLPAGCAQIIYLAVDSRQRTQAMRCGENENVDIWPMAGEYEKSSQQSVRLLTGGGRSRKLMRICGARVRVVRFLRILMGFYIGSNTHTYL